MKYYSYSICFFFFVSISFSQWDEPKKTFYWLEGSFGQYESTNFDGYTWEISYQHVENHDMFMLTFQNQSLGFLLSDVFDLYFEKNKLFSFQYGRMEFFSSGRFHYTAGIGLNILKQRKRNDLSKIQKKTYLSIPAEIQYSFPITQSLKNGISLSVDYHPSRSVYSINYSFLIGGINKIDPFD